MPGIRLEITVDDKGSPVVRQFNQEVGKTPAATQQAERGLQGLASSAGSLTSSLGAAAKQGAVFALAFAGVQSVASVLGAAATAAAQFQVNLANVSTLIAGPSTEAVARLRQGLLDLPPALGQSTQLAQGLYSALSGGIEAGEAVRFVATSAKAAQAGLTDLSAATDSIVGILQAYSLRASDASRVSDVLFQTVNVGRGNFNQFSSAFAQVAPLASQLGISLEETSATLGTLSFAFPTASQGATSFTSILANLIQRGPELAALGVDVKRVIAEEGLTGLLRRLSEVTGGSSTALQRLIGDQEGLRGVIALNGPFLERQAQNLRDVGLAAGASEEAFRKQSATASAAFATLGANLERLAQEAAPPFLALATGTANIASGLVTLARNVLGEVVEAFSQLRIIFPELAAQEAALANQYKTSAQFARENAATQKTLTESKQGATKASSELSTAQAALEALQQSGTASASALALAQARVANASQANAKALGEQERAQKTADAATLAASASINELEQFTNRMIETFHRQAQQAALDAQTIQAAYAGLGVKASEDLKRLADAAIENFLAVEATGKESPVRLRAIWEDQVGKIIAAYGVLPGAAKDIQARIDDAIRPENLLKIRPFIQQVQDDFRRLGIQSALELHKSADEQVKAFDRVLKGGLATPAQLQQRWAQLRADLIALYGTLPPAFANYDEQIRRSGEGTAQGVQAAYERLGIKTTEALQKTALDALAAFQQILADGQATPQQLLAEWQKILRQISDAGFKTLPPGFAAMAQQMQEIARKLGVELPKPFLDAFQTINTTGRKVAEDFGQKFDETFKALATAGATNTRQLAASLTEAQIKSSFELGLISRSARDTALALKQAGTDGGQGLADGVGAGAEEARRELASVAAQADSTARQVRIVFQQAFGDTPRQLFEQLGDQQARIRNANEIAAAAGLTEPGNFEAYRKEILDSASDAIFLITERLKDLGYNADGTKIMLDALADSTTNLTESTSTLERTSAQLGATTTATTMALSAQSSGVLTSLGAGYMQAAVQAQGLIDKQRELLLIGTGSQITDRPGRTTPVAAGGVSGALPGLPGGSVLPGGFSPDDLGLNLTIPTQPERDILPVRVPAAPGGTSQLLRPSASVVAPPVSGTAPSSTLGGGVRPTQPSGGGSGVGGFITDRVPTITGGPTITGNPTLTGTTRSNINVYVTPMALTRGAAQDLADHLAPALRELQRLGRI